MDTRRFEEILRRSATGGTSRRALLKGIAGVALASGGALAVTSRVEAASACENRQREICKNYWVKGEPTTCQDLGLTQGECIQRCTADRTKLKCA